VPWLDSDPVSNRTSHKHASPTATTRPNLIVVRGVTRVIGPESRGVQILDDVSFVVPAVSLFAINGPSGSGKSTLLNLLTGIDHPTRGEIVFDGQSILARSENALARWRGSQVGIVFQAFLLIPTLTALENVLLALELGAAPVPRSQWRTRALQCLAMVEMDAYARRLPGELSGGQQQRVAIARAMANDPPLIVADEPTGNLDSTTAGSVFAVLEALPGAGKTVIYVTHDRALASRADASIDLLDGRVSARHNSPAPTVTQ
jgi:ABC-type lipoprotein export system ATPase subunit